MKWSSPPRIVRPLVAATLILLSPVGVHAQQIILKGEYGLLAGVTPPPGLYVGALGVFSWQDELKNADGTTTRSEAGFNEVGFAPLISWVSKYKLFGGTYSAQIAPPWASTKIDYPRLDTSTSTGTAFSQIWIVPLSLGWTLPRGAVTFSYALYPPTGRYTAGASDNTGLGMWVNEFSLRGTYYLDKAGTWHASLSTFYDINGKKKGIDWTTGNPLTLMYGVGRNYGTGSLKGWAGITGYSQWQVSTTKGSDVPQFVQDGKSSINGIGPELTTLEGAFTIRYFWQYGADFSLQGTSLYAQFAMPI